MQGWRVDERVVGGELVTEVEVGLWTTIQDSLHDLFSPFPDHIPADNAAGSTVYRSQDVGFVFLSQVKVKTSSNSTIFGVLSGSGGVLGRLAA